MKYNCFHSRIFTHTHKCQEKKNRRKIVKEKLALSIEMICFGFWGMDIRVGQIVR